MLEEVKQLVTEINNTNINIMGVSKSIIDLDNKRLEAVVDIALKGIELNKIWSNKSHVILTEGENAPIKYEYLKKLNSEEYLKGVRVGYYKGENYQSDVCCEKEEQYELWLLIDQFIVTKVSGIKIKEQWGRVNFKREVIKFDSDPFELNEDMSYRWDIDNIVTFIISNLKQRKENLDNRLIKQVDRLNRLNMLQI